MAEEKKYGELTLVNPPLPATRTGVVPYTEPLKVVRQAKDWFGRKVGNAFIDYDENNKLNWEEESEYANEQPIYSKSIFGDNMDPGILGTKKGASIVQTIAHTIGVDRPVFSSSTSDPNSITLPLALLKVPETDEQVLRRTVKEMIQAELQQMDVFLGGTIAEIARFAFTDPRDRGHEYTMYRNKRKNILGLADQVELLLYSALEGERVFKALGMETPGYTRFAARYKEFKWDTHYEKPSMNAGPVALLTDAVIRHIRYPLSLTNDELELLEQPLEDISKMVNGKLPKSSHDSLMLARKIGRYIMQYNPPPPPPMPPMGGECDQPCQKPGDNDLTPDAQQTTSKKKSNSGSGTPSPDDGGDGSGGDAPEDGSDVGDQPKNGSGSDSGTPDKKPGEQGKSKGKPEPESEEESADSKDNQGDGKGADGGDKKDEGDDGVEEEKDKKDGADGDSEKSDKGETDGDEDSGEKPDTDDADDEDDGDDGKNKSDADGDQSGDQTDTERKQGSDEKTDQGQSEPQAEAPEPIDPMEGLPGMLEMYASMLSELNDFEDTASSGGGAGMTSRGGDGKEIISNLNTDFTMVSFVQTEDIEVVFTKIRGEQSVYRMLASRIDMGKAALIANLLKRKVRDYQISLKGMRSGHLDPTKIAEAYQGVETVYERHGQVKTPKLNITVLIDESGSMSGAGKIDNAKLAAIMLQEIIARIPDIELNVYGHHTTRGTTKGGHGVAINVYRENGFTQGWGISKAFATEANRDGTAITEVAKRVRRFNKDAGIFIVVSDGLPVSAPKNMDPVTHTRLAVEGVEKMGFLPVQIAIDQSVNSASMFKHFVKMINISKLPADLAAFLKTKLNVLIKEATTF